MLYAFALHAESNRIALLRGDAEGTPWIELRTLAGQPLGEIAADFLPHGPRWSPDGAILAFYSNDGKLYLYRLGSPAPHPIVEEPSFQAGFAQWSPEGKRLVFSAYGSADSAPPNIYSVDLGVLPGCIGFAVTLAHQIEPTIASSGGRDHRGLSALEHRSSGVV